MVRTKQLTKYPTLSLFRKIMRAHQRHLPEAHRALGNDYVRAEFRLHRDADP